MKVGEGSREGLGIMGKGLGLEDELHEGLEQGVDLRALGSWLFSLGTMRKKGNGPRGCPHGQPP